MLPFISQHGKADSSSSEVSSKRPRIDGECSGVTMAAVDDKNSMMVDGEVAKSSEIFDNKTKAIIWGMQPRAVQVKHEILSFEIILR